MSMDCLTDGHRESFQVKTATLDKGNVFMVDTTCVLSLEALY
jgi:hypothetical protein